MTCIVLYHIAVRHRTLTVGARAERGRLSRTPSPPAFPSVSLIQRSTHGAKRMKRWEGKLEEMASLGGQLSLTYIYIYIYTFIIIMIIPTLMLYAFMCVYPSLSIYLSICVSLSLYIYVCIKLLIFMASFPS